MIKKRGSGTWPVAKATVTRSACPKAMFGCDLAEVYYTYRVDGELYTGINEKPFISQLLVRQSAGSNGSRVSRYCLHGEYRVIQSGLPPRCLVDREDFNIVRIPKRDTGKSAVCLYGDCRFATHFIQWPESVDS